MRTELEVAHPHGYHYQRGKIIIGSEKPIAGDTTIYITFTVDGEEPRNVEIKAADVPQFVDALLFHAKHSALDAVTA